MVKSSMSRYIKDKVEIGEQRGYWDKANVIIWLLSTWDQTKLF